MFILFIIYVVGCILAFDAAIGMPEIQIKTKRIGKTMMCFVYALLSWVGLIILEKK